MNTDMKRVVEPAMWISRGRDSKRKGPGVSNFRDK